MTAPLPPVALFVAQTPTLQRTTLIGIIEHLMAGTADVTVVAQWALRSFHDMVQIEDDEDSNDSDTDDDDVHDIGVDQAIMDALDALMFADQAAFTPDTAQLQLLIRQLQA